MKNKKVLIINIIAIIAICLIIFSNNKKQENIINEPNTPKEQQEQVQVQELENGVKINTNENLKQTKKIESFEISNIQLTEKNGQTRLLANVKNITQSDTKTVGINIVFIDKNNKEITKIPGAISPLKAGETKQLNISITGNYVDIYDFKIEIQK